MEKFGKRKEVSKFDSLIRQKNRSMRKGPAVLALLIALGIGYGVSRKYNSRVPENLITQQVKTYLNANDSLYFLDKRLNGLDEQSLPYIPEDFPEELGQIFAPNYEQPILESMVSAINEDINEMETLDEIITYNNAKNESMDVSEKAFYESLGFFGIGALYFVVNSIRSNRRYHKGLLELNAQAKSRE